MVNAVVANPRFFADATEAGVRSAYDAAVATGGGVVVLPATTIQLTSPLPLSHGVYYEGTGWSPNFTPQGPYSGTILIGDGTFEGFVYNHTWNGETPIPITGENPDNNFDLFNNGGHSSVDGKTYPGMLRGAGISNLTLLNFSYGVKIGDIYKSGCQECLFERLNFAHCNQWSFYCENMSESVFRWFNVVQPVELGTGTPAVGTICFRASGGMNWNNGVTTGTSQMNCGNSWFEHILSNVHSQVTRGIVFEARGEIYGRLNILNCHDIQVLRDNAGAQVPTIIGVTATSGSPNLMIGTGNISKLRVGMPLTFSSSAAGFAATQLYFVSALDAPTGAVQVSQYVGGPVSTASSSTTFDIQTFGFPHVELLGEIGGLTAFGSSIFSGLDLEGSGTTAVLFNGVDTTRVHCNWVDAPGDGNYRTFTLRIAVDCEVDCPKTFTFDADNSSNSSILTGACAEWNAANSSGVSALGFRVNKQSGIVAPFNTGGLYLSSFGTPDLYVNPLTFGPAFSSNFVLPQQTFASGAAISFGAGIKQPGTFVYAGNTPGTVSLGSITADLVGLRLLMVNPSGSDLLLYCQSGQNFNLGAAGPSPTPYTIGPHTSVLIEASTDGTSRFWALR
ncbi:MAG TPA: hypothetical protein VNR11_17815 [Xanthobacteraceae bacterium]|nr:hypothetical protein [Xanthobacteraceae bacterium]